jgi:hypothetical protein
MWAGLVGTIRNLIAVYSVIFHSLSSFLPFFSAGSNYVFWRDASNCFLIKLSTIDSAPREPQWTTKKAPLFMFWPGGSLWGEWWMWRWEFSKLLMANMIKSFPIHDVRGEQSREFSIFCCLPPGSGGKCAEHKCCGFSFIWCVDVSGYRRCKSRSI